MFPEDLLPHLPGSGPPVPRFMPKWPWTNNPDPILVDYKVLDSAVDKLREDKKNEWLAKGYRPGLVNMALEWADNWTEGMLRSPLYAFFTSEQKMAMAPQFYKYALDRAERWIAAFSFS